MLVRRIAIICRDECASVVDFCRRSTVGARVTDLGGQATSVTGDVTIAADLVRMRERILGGYGHLDVVVSSLSSMSRTNFAGDLGMDG